MTAEWIARRREIELAATEGPWEWEEPSTNPWPQADQSLVAPSVQDSEGYPGDVLYGWGYDASGTEARSEDRAFIADARTSLPRALDALEKVLELTKPDDGSEYSHHGHSPLYDDTECPACWAANIRDVIAEALTGGEHDDPR